MWRQRALRILLVLFGLIFVGGVYPLITSVRSGWQANKEDSLPMGLSLYVMMGIFLLLAARNPSVNRAVIVSCHRHDGHGSSPSKRAPRFADSFGCVCWHRCSPDLAGSGEAASGYRQSVVGSHSAEPPTPTSPS